MISYGKCTKAQYEALTPVQDRIYYITDTGEQFLNGLPYNGEDNKDYLCLTAETDGATVGLKYDATPSAYPVVWHSADRRTWTAFEWTGNATDVATLANAGDKVYLRAFNGGFGNTATESTNLKFSMTGTIAASGNVMSLLHGDDFETRSEVPAFGFQNLFRGCASLVEPPEMPAIRLGVRAYYCMFYGCALRHCPELPARTLTQACYGSMFGGGHQQFDMAEIGASSFKADPDFPLSETAPLNKMFKGCSSLATVTAHFELWSTTDIGTVATNWLQNTSTTGVFKCPSALDTTTRDASHVPAGWSVIYTDIEASKTIPSATSSDAGKVLTVNASGTPEWDDAQGGGEDTNDYLCFTAGQANSTVNFKKDGNPDAIDIEYSTNNKESWNDYTWATNDGLTITLNSGDSVYFRAKSTNAHMGKGWSDYHFFRFGGIIYASGNVMSLLDKTCKLNEVTDKFCFVYLFSGFNQPANNLYSAPELPAKKLAGVYCYANMFYECTHLTAMPELPATILSEGCYNGLFSGCTSLNVVKSIPIATLAPYCFSDMFSGCTSLRRTPELPALELAKSCYTRMFSGCKGLESAGELPATTLAESCYYGMFSGCTSLKKAPKIYATTFIQSCFEQMFYNCRSLVDGDFGVPVDVGVARVLYETFMDCPSLAVAPKFTGNVVGTYAFIRAFRGCTSLHYLKASWTSWNQKYPSSDWFDNASTTGVFDCPSTLDTTTYVPSGWTVTHGANEPSDDTTSVAEATDTTIYTVCPGSKETGVVTVSNTLTLNAYPATSTDIAYAEVVLDIASGATVTAGTNLTLVDTPTAGKRNVCVVRWSGGVAKLYVTIVEDLPQA